MPNKNLNFCEYCEERYCIDCCPPQFDAERFCSKECQDEWNRQNTTAEDNIWSDL